jgi:ribonuclease Z
MKKHIIQKYNRYDLKVCSHINLLMVNDHYDIICQNVENDNSTLYMWNIWNQHAPYILYAEHKLQGYSWAAHRTTFIIKSLSVQFDAGLSLNTHCENIFITHFHGDHVGTLRFDITNPRIKLFVPETHMKQVKDYLIAYYAMIDTHFSEEMFKFKLIGVKEGDKYDLDLGGKKFIVNVYKCDHSINCFAYGFEEIYKSLKLEFKGLDGKELGKLRKSGIKIEEFKSTPRFIYVGDTSVNIYESNPYIFMYKTIIAECTFLYDDHLEHAKTTKHTHYSLLKPYIEIHPECKFILYHFSLRYKQKQLKQFFNENVLENVYPWICN